MGNGRVKLPDDLRIMPLDPLHAKSLQKICTVFGFAKRCPYGVCRRAGHCATREVMCWQVTRDVVDPVIRLWRARQWSKAVATGRDIDIAPAVADMYRRILADEARVWEEFNQRLEAAPAEADARAISPGDGHEKESHHDPSRCRRVDL